MGTELLDKLDQLIRLEANSCPSLLREFFSKAWCATTSRLFRLPEADLWGSQALSGGVVICSAEGEVEPSQDGQGKGRSCAGLSNLQAAGPDGSGHERSARGDPVGVGEVMMLLRWLILWTLGQVEGDSGRAADIPMTVRRSRSLAARPRNSTTRGSLSGCPFAV